MDVSGDFIYGGLNLWMFFQLPVSLKLSRCPPTPGAESRGGCEPQRQFSMETRKGDKCSSTVTGRKRNERLELFQRCFLEMGQG